MTMEGSSTVKLPWLNANELLQTELKEGQRIQVCYRYQGESRSLYATVLEMMNIPAMYGDGREPAVRVIYCGDEAQGDTRAGARTEITVVLIASEREPAEAIFSLVKRGGKAVFKILDDRQRRPRQHLDGVWCRRLR